MRKKRTNYRKRPKVKQEIVSDIEVAKKMIKIYQSAEDRNLDFDLSFETVKQLLLDPVCYYTERPFEENGQYARSFDRIDSDKGYIEGNVVACTVDINSKKSNLSFKEIELLYTKLNDFQSNTQEEEDEEENQDSSEEEVKT